ncbi:MAG: dockerin type I repeat-containing protein [Bacteroidaceae bacterium]|nr:dockerin type I repeat-containing protein [Bacteroidaceae bacterium]
MKRTRRFLTALIMALASTLSASAASYRTYLTALRGFVEVTSTDALLDGDYYYILTAAENPDLIVGIGAYEAKPGWASEDTKALRYLPTTADPVLNLSNFFTIEKDGQYIGFRNAVYSSDMFQTHDNAGYMYVNTYTDKSLDEWSQLAPTYQDGYWLFESGKYPISSGNWACGYLGPWNQIVAIGEPIALNRRNTAGDLAGHYRLFRIAKSTLLTLWNEAWGMASPTSPVDATDLIVNPSFESGNEWGWTLNGKDENGNDEFKTRDYGMTNKDGQYLMNAYQWWAPSLSISQTVENVPSGNYELSAVLATWEGRTVKLTANGVSTTVSGQGDGTGIPTSVTTSVGADKKLTIRIESTGQWWAEGHEGETQTFFKADNLRLRCKGLTLNGIALPLPNDASERLVAGQWYYYDVPHPTEYWLSGNISGMVMSTDGDLSAASATTQAARRELTLNCDRVFFNTQRSDATLTITPERTLQQGTFTAVALNVDGLPNKIATFDLNPDGPGRDGTLKISKYLASKNYDFIGCSEDFNYNGALMESLNDRYRCGTIRNTLSVSDIDYLKLIQGKIHVDTDGLNLIWKYSNIDAENESWTKWNDTESTDGNQYVTKGYRHYDVQLDGGPVIDVFILHMDAGDTNATWSRESQWRQLTDAINATDANRPKLIIGDTNSRWTREDIITNFLNRLSSNLTASDVWVEFYRSGIYPTTVMDNLTDKSDPTNYTNYEIVDKIIYINPTAANTTRLRPLSFRIEQDYTYGTIDGTDDTTPLGDHNPVVVQFAYTCATSEPQSFQTPGDLNFDSKVTIADVTALVNILLNKDNGDTHQYDHDAADVNGDGTVSIADVTALVNIILKK